MRRRRKLQPVEQVRPSSPAPITVEASVEIPDWVRSDARHDENAVADYIGFKHRRASTQVRASRSANWEPHPIVRSASGEIVEEGPVS